MAGDEQPVIGYGAPREVPPRPGRSWMGWILGLLAGAVLTVLLLGAGLWMATGYGLYHFIDALRSGGTRINVDQPTVVHQIQQLKRLETVSYTMDKIISGEHDNAYLPKFLAGDRLLLVVHGEVVAGIDLAGLQARDVAIAGQKITIHLPAAMVFSTRIDNAKTRVYSRDTGLFSSPDPNLESEVRVEAEKQLQQAALQDGILLKAGENARGTIGGMLQGLGFREVEIR
jgi:type IV secretory pathway TrbD component